jgi:hypothetical protein
MYTRVKLVKGGYLGVVVVALFRVDYFADF